MVRINVKNWKNFILSRIFLIKSPSSRTIKDYSEGETPYVSSGGINNGIVSYLEPKEEEKLEKGNCISISPLEGTPCFYQKDDFLGRGGAGSAISLLYNNNLNEYNALFICEVIKASAKKFNYSDAFNSDNLKTLSIKLPVKKKDYVNETEKNYEPDWKYMEEFMMNIEKKARSKINDLNFIKGNQTSIDVSKWKRFNLYDINLFEISSGNKFDRSKMQSTNPTVNFVGRSGKNNGVTCEVDEIDGIKPFTAGSMTIALGGNIGSCFIQKKDFYTSQNVIVLIPRWEMNEEVKLFISSVIFRESQMYYKTFEDELNRHISTDFSIMLPVDTNDIPDWNFMKNFIETINRKSEERIRVLKDYFS